MIKDFEDSANKVKNPEEAAEIVKEMKKIIKSKKCSTLLLTYQQGQIIKKI